MGCLWLLPLLLLLSIRSDSSIVVGQTKAPGDLTSAASPAARSISAIQARIHPAYGKLPLYFTENKGQLPKRVAYYTQGRNATVYFTRHDVTFALTGTRLEQAVDVASTRKQSWRRVALDEEQQSNPERERWALRLNFPGANPKLKLSGQSPSPTRISYFKGPRSQWKTALPTYSTLTYSNLWRDIDLAYAGTADRLKYTFIVKPGADPRRVRLQYRGAISLKVTQAGQLEVSTPVGSFQDDKPSAYQDVEGRRVDIPISYAIAPKTVRGVRAYGFKIGTYDRRKTLVLDPAVLIYAGYIGGSDDDEGEAIAVDAAGNAYITGRTASSQASFPVNTGPDLTYNGKDDAFVVKINAAGTALLYAGYIGGTGDDKGLGIALDSTGNAYITGRTNSNEASFPVKTGPDLTFNSTGVLTFDAFVAKISADGGSLVYCGYVGGADLDEGLGIAVDSSGSAYITGRTFSSASTFPVKTGPDLTFHGSGAAPSADAFVAKVKADGTGLEYCGYIGGASTDVGADIAVDSTGSAYITGRTSSNEASFPVRVGPDLTFNGGSSDRDAFVAKVQADGTGLVYCGYIGGTNSDEGFDIAVDAAGSAYVTGRTSSNQSSFPVRVGPDLTFNGSGAFPTPDAFVAKVKADGTGLEYCGYIGGDATDTAYDIAIDGAGNAYVIGETASTQATFPVTGGPGLTFKGVRDAFVAKVKSDGTGLEYCGYIGGIGTDAGLGIAVDRAGDAYIIGDTRSNESTFPVTAGPDLTFNGKQDVFVAKISVAGPLGPQISFAQFGNGQGISSTLILVNPSTTQTATGTVKLLDSNGNPLSVKINGTLQNGSFSFSIAPEGVAFFSTDGLGSVVVGWAQVNSNIALGGTILFAGSFGVAGVPATQPAARFLVPIESNTASSVRTGVALSNPTAASLTVTLNLRNGSAVLVSNGSIQVSLPANGQLAKFAEELYADRGIDFNQFRGTLEVVSAIPVNGMAIRVSPGAFATLPVTTTEQGNPKFYFAQFGNGQGITSTVILINPSAAQSASGSVRIFDSNGNPLSVIINRVAQSGSFAFNVPAQGVAFFDTDGNGALTVGSVQVTSDIGIGGSCLLEVLEWQASALCNQP